VTPRGSRDPGPEDGDREDRSDFDDQVYPRSYPVPGRLNLKQALRAYVHGHDRGWDADRKAELAAEGEDEGFTGAGQALESGERTGPADGDGRDDDARPDETGKGSRYGVPVPETLDFHRGAAIWRDRIPRPRRSRRPAGWSGQGSGGDGPGGEDGEGRRGA
jgi:hypothetical protein